MVSVGLRNSFGHPLVWSENRNQLEANRISNEHLQVKQQHKELKQWNKNRDVREVSGKWIF